MRFTTTDLTFEPYLPNSINHLELSGIHYQGRQIAVRVERMDARVIASRID
jgi:trehalose/maltose hydrolase-like predicted phosphorylase